MNIVSLVRAFSHISDDTVSGAAPVFAGTPIHRDTIGRAPKAFVSHAINISPDYDSYHTASQGPTAAVAPRPTHSCVRAVAGPSPGPRAHSIVLLDIIRAFDADAADDSTGRLAAAAGRDDVRHLPGVGLGVVAAAEDRRTVPRHVGAAVGRSPGAPRLRGDHSVTSTLARRTLLGAGKVHFKSHNYNYNINCYFIKNIKYCRSHG